MALLQGTWLGPYEVIAPLGSGGMGEVYRARDTRLGREVAIKVLPADKLSDPARRARFEQEARTAAALHHPHIVTIYEIRSGRDRLLGTLDRPINGLTRVHRRQDGSSPRRRSVRAATWC